MTGKGIAVPHKQWDLGKKRDHLKEGLEGESVIESQHSRDLTDYSNEGF